MYIRSLDTLPPSRPQLQTVWPTMEECPLRRSAKVHQGSRSHCGWEFDPHSDSHWGHSPTRICLQWEKGWFSSFPPLKPWLYFMCTSTVPDCLTNSFSICHAGEDVAPSNWNLYFINLPLSMRHTQNVRAENSYLSLEIWETFPRTNYFWLIFVTSQRPPLIGNTHCRYMVPEPITTGFVGRDVFEEPSCLMAWYSFGRGQLSY